MLRAAPWAFCCRHRWRRWTRGLTSTSIWKFRGDCQWVAWSYSYVKVFNILILNTVLLVEDIKLHQWLVLYLPGGSFPSIPENIPTLLVCCYINLFNFCPDIWSDVLCPRDLTGGNLSLPEGIPAGSSTGVVQLADLQRILSGIGQPPGKFLYPPHFHVTGNGSPLSFFSMDRYWFVCLTNYVIDEYV